MPPRILKYTSAFEPRELTLTPGHGEDTFTLHAPAERGTVQIASGTLSPGLSDAAAAEAAERSLVQGADLWQPRLRRAGLLGGHRLRFPGEYVHGPVQRDAAFQRTQHFEDPWHLAPNVTVRPGARLASMSCGNVLVLPGKKSLTC